jgi:hypothetical protein
MMRMATQRPPFCRRPVPMRASCMCVATQCNPFCECRPLRKHPEGPHGQSCGKKASGQQHQKTCRSRGRGLRLLVCSASGAGARRVSFVTTAPLERLCLDGILNALQRPLFNHGAELDRRPEVDELKCQFVFPAKRLERNAFSPRPSSLTRLPTENPSQITKQLGHGLRRSGLRPARREGTAKSVFPVHGLFPHSGVITCLDST